MHAVLFISSMRAVNLYNRQNYKREEVVKTSFQEIVANTLLLAPTNKTSGQVESSH